MPIIKKSDLEGDNEIPRQAVPRSKKTEEWAAATVNAYYNMSRFGDSGTTPDITMNQLYEQYEGSISDQEYNDVLSVFGGEISNVPAKLRNYNITKPIADTPMGERSKRPIQSSVIITNPDAITVKQHVLSNEVKRGVFQNALAVLEQNGVKTTEDGQQRQKKLPSDIISQFEENYRSGRAINGQHAINFIRQYNKVEDKLQTAFKDIVIAGQYCSLKYIENNEPKYDILDPRSIDYISDSTSRFIEDGQAAIIVDYLHTNSAIDAYHRFLSKEEIDILEDANNAEDRIRFTGESRKTDKVYSTYDDTSHANNYAVRHDHHIERVRVYWKSLMKVGFVTFTDDFGVQQEKVVDEGYDLKKGEEVDWRWISQVWQGHRLDGDIFIKLQPFEVQRRSLDNPSTAKLPLNGVKLNERGNKPLSIVSVIRPFQILYDIIRYRFELAIAKSKDVVSVFDINMIPDKIGSHTGIEAFMHFIEVTGIAFVDYNQEGLQLNAQHQSIIDLSMKTIGSYIELLEMIRDEAERSTGITRQRKGSVQSSDGKGVTQQGIIQSTNLTEPMFNAFNQGVERDFQGLLDISKYAWRNGKKGTYNLEQGAVQHFDIVGEDFKEAEFGIFVSDSRQDLENLETVKELSQAAIQNGTPFSDITELIESRSISSIKDKLKEAEELRGQQEQQIQQQEQQLRSLDLEIKNRELDILEANNIRNNRTKLEEFLASKEIERDENQAKFKQEKERLADKENLDRDKMSIERKKVQEDVRSNKADEEIERKKIKQIKKSS